MDGNAIYNCFYDEFNNSTTVKGNDQRRIFLYQRIMLDREGEILKGKIVKNLPLGISKRDYLYLTLFCYICELRMPEIIEVHHID